VLGTPEYLAAEQLRGAGLIDQRADVFPARTAFELPKGKKSSERADKKAARPLCVVAW
jgi:hypothetical protein